MIVGGDYMLRSNIEAALEANTKELARVQLELARIKAFKVTCSDPAFIRCYKAELEYWEASKDLYEFRIERLKDKLEEFENE